MPQLIGDVYSRWRNKKKGNNHAHTETDAKRQNSLDIGKIQM